MSHVLIVDDTLENIKVLKGLLELEGFRISVATSGERAIKILKHSLPDVILLDVMMPGIDGFETCEQIKKNSNTQHIPVIFITAKDDTESLIKGFNVGGADYLTKPFQQKEVLARLRVHLENQMLLKNQAETIKTRNQMIESLEEAMRMQELFLASMSHEIRTPLSAIIGYSEMLLEDAACEESKDDINHITHAGRYLLKLINNILDVSKLEVGQMELHIEPFSINDLVFHLTATLQPLIKKNNNTFKTTVAPEINVIITDSIRLEQILVNLLGNACKFTHNGEITLNIQVDEHYIQFQVSDTGIGITDKDLNYIFQPYRQAGNNTQKCYAGTGLGLYLSQKLCHMMGGEITVTSKPNQGSTFTVHLPHHDDDITAIAEI